jgi:hypothetical protein
MAVKKTNERASPVAVNVIPTHIYRGVLRITTKSQSVSAHESNSYESTDEKDVLLSASPSTVNSAFAEVIAEMRNTYANPEMVSIVLIEYRDQSSDNLCYSVI